MADVVAAAAGRLAGLPVVGLVAGSRSTKGCERVLGNAIAHAGGQAITVRAFWWLRPNDEDRLDVTNRQVAIEQVTALGRHLPPGNPSH